MCFFLVGLHSLDGVAAGQSVTVVYTVLADSL